MNVGDYVQRTIGLELGKVLQAPIKAQMISATRWFFLDAQDWEWLPPRIDPYWALATRAPSPLCSARTPRVIAGDVWGKLLWIGLNLTEGDLPPSKAGFFYLSNWSRP